MSRLHPEAPLPGVYKAEALFADAERLRGQIGDEAFFGQLNAGAAVARSGWGTVAAGWDITSFQQARRAAPGHELRTRLVGELVQTFFASYRDVVRGQEEAYVPLDIVLSAISSHAKGLGYDAVILFLDELILWLASHASDPAFISREGQKLAPSRRGPARPPSRPDRQLRRWAARPARVGRRPRDRRRAAGLRGHPTLVGGALPHDHARGPHLPAIAERRVLKPRSRGGPAADGRGVPREHLPSGDRLADRARILPSTRSTGSFSGPATE